MLMDVEIRHLRLISAVADLGSLTKAGDRLHLTQSALSHQLRDIESRLGAALFLRVGKRLLLTPAGERLLASARDVLERLDRTETEIRQMAHDRAGLIRLSTECYTCYHWLPPLLAKYRPGFPRVDVQIDVAATHRPLERMLAGKLELAIVSSPVRDRRLTVRPLFDDELVVIASPDHRFARQTHVKLADIREETLFVYPPREESLVLQNVLLPAGAAPARVEEVQLTEAITELVRAGLGIAILAPWAVRPLVERGALVARPLTARGLKRQWSAVMPKDLAEVDYLREFVDLMARNAPNQSLRRAAGGSRRIARRTGS
jgi:LysR family transcriptional regulator, regulator for metE and metH